MTTNKRFVNEGKDIFQYGEWWCSAGGEHCADVIATAINEFIEENKQLKKILNELSDMLQFDVENGIRSYPVKLSEYLSNALKELKE